MSKLLLGGLAAAFMVPVVAAAAQSTSTITTTADFQTRANNEGLVSTAGDQLTRDSLTSGRVGAWASTTAFPSARRGVGVAAYNGRVYVAGGIDASNLYPNDVRYAPINSDGTLGAWATATGFSTGRHNLTCAPYNGYLYLLGGRAGTTYYADVQFAAVNSDGTLGAWSPTTSLPTAREGHASVVCNGYLYVLGGSSAGGLLNDVVFAAIRADGTLGAWTATATLPSVRAFHAAAAYGGHIYLLGGGDGANNHNSVHYASVNPDGTLGAWAATASFATVRQGHGAVAWGGYLYVFAGWNGSSQGDAQFAPILPSGALGAWSPTALLATAREYAGAAVHNGHIYAVAGQTSGTANISTVEFAKIEGPGTVGNWTATTPFPTARWNHASVVHNGYLYVMGGYDGFAFRSDVQYGPINADGTVGTWAGTTPFSTGRNTYDSVVYNGYVYVLGGSNAVSYFNDVQYAATNSDGTLGAWSLSTPFGTSRSGHASVAYDGYMYVLGGTDGLAYRNDVQYSPITPNGTLGPWTTTSPIATARRFHTSVAYNGHLYVIGGYDGTNLLADVQYAQINTDGSLGTWNTTTSFTTNRYLHASVAHSGYLYVVGGGGGGSIEYAPINADGTVGPWSSTRSIDMTPVREGHTSVVWNGHLYVIGGNDVGVSLLNDVQVAPINLHGTVGTWAPTTSFSPVRDSHTSVMHNGNAYVIGGWDGGAYTNLVHYAPANADGTLGAWTATPPFSGPRSRHSSVAYDNFLYVIGGQFPFTNDVQFAPISPSGSLGPWTSTASFATPRSGHSSVAHNGYIYVIGGYDGGAPFAEVQFAPVNANGTVGNWTTTTPLPAGRFLHASVACNGYVYVAGGYDGTNWLDGVLLASINADGSLGAWTTVASLPARRSEVGIGTSNGFLYVTGGHNGVTPSATVFSAPIQSDGKLGAWNTTTPLATARYLHTSAIHNGLLYVLGGINSTGSTLGDVEFAPLRTPALRGYWSKLVDLGADATASAITLNGSAANKGTVRLQYRLATTGNPAFGAETVVESVTLGTPVAVGATARYVWVRVTLDDTQSASQRDVTDILIDYAVAGTTPVIALSPSGLAFTATVGGADPAAQTFTVTNAGGGTLAFTLTDNAAWLTKTPTSGSIASGASQTVTVSVSVASLAASTYTGTITVTDPAATNSPQTLGVTLTVNSPVATPPAVPATIGVSPAALAFGASQGGGIPPSQSVTVTNTGAAGSTLTWTATWAEAWLFAAPTTGTLDPGASANLTVFADPTGLAPGTYTGTITVADPWATNTPQTVAVTLTITGDTTPPVITSATATPNAGTAPLLVVFQAAATDDTGVALYQWDFDGDGVWDWESEATATAIFSYDVAGIYTAKLRVSDAAGNFADATVVVSVTGAPAGLQLTADSYSGLVPPAFSVTYTLTGAVTGALVGVIWDFDGDWAPDGFSEGLTATHSFIGPGSYLAHSVAIYTDGSAQVATLSPGPVVVTFDMSQFPPPTATIVKVFRDLDGNGTFSAGDEDITVSLQAEEGDLVGFEYAGSVSHPSLSILKYEWSFDGDAEPEVGSDAAGTVVWGFTEKGEVEVSLTVTDTADGANARAQGETSRTLTVTATPGRKLWLEQPGRPGEQTGGTDDTFIIHASGGGWDWGPENGNGNKPTTADLEASTDFVAWYSLTNAGWTTPKNGKKLTVDIVAAAADGLVIPGQMNWFRVKMKLETGQVKVSPPLEVMVDNTQPGGFGSPYRKILVLDGNEAIEYETPGTGLSVPYGALVGTVTIEDSETGPAAPDGVTFVGVWRTITATGALTKPARVRIYWPDADGDGVVDGSGMAGTALRMYRRRADGAWEVLTGQTADPAEAWVEATTTGFSVFALGTGTPRSTAATTTAEAGDGGGGGGCAARAGAGAWLVLALLLGAAAMRGIAARLR